MVSEEGLGSVEQARTPKAMGASARWSLWIALLSIVFPPLGLVALAMGSAALRRSAARFGPAAALAAVTIGGISTLSLGALIADVAIARRGFDAPVRTLPPAPRTLQVSEDLSFVPMDAVPAGQGVTIERTGALEVVLVGPTVRSLRDELRRQHDLAGERGQVLLLFVTVADCAPCDDTYRALSAPRLQASLAGSRLVSVSADQFAIELARMGVPVSAFPGFALVGPEGRVVDYVNGGEWDEDIPENIAPVLKSFVDGTYGQRRERWQPRHDDETAI
jgi:hypothetical protein